MEKNRARIMSIMIKIILSLIIVLVFPSCEDVFTTAPLAILARDPSSLPPAQKVSFAMDALDSGDADLITEAYNSIKDYLEDADLTGAEAVEVNSLAVELMAVDTGIGPLFDDTVAGFVSSETPDAAAILANLKDLELDTDDSADMQEYMDAIIANDGDPTPSQALLAATVVMAPIINARDIEEDGSFDLETLTPAEQESLDAATSYIEAAVAGLGDDAEESEFLYSLTDYIGINDDES